MEHKVTLSNWKIAKLPSQYLPYEYFSAKKNTILIETIENVIVLKNDFMSEILKYELFLYVLNVLPYLCHTKRYLKNVRRTINGQGVMEP